MATEIKKIFIPGVGEVDAEVEAGRAFNKEKQAEILEETWTTEAGAHTESLLKYENQRARELNLTPEQRYWAVSLALINMREHFPAGTAAADTLQQGASDYFDKNQPTVKK